MGETRSWDHEADIVVVGSGAAALAAALTVSVGGARVVILEKSLVLGGTTAMSGAGTWIPANHHMLAAGMTDSKDEALTYLRATAPAGWEAEEDALWQSFVEHAPAMLAFVEANTPLRFELVHHPDLYVEAPVGKFRGRMVSPLPISRNILGRWRNRIRSSTLPQIFTYREMVIGTVLSRPVRTLSRMAPSLLYRLLTRRVGMGNALVSGLLKGCLDRGCEIMAGTAAERLITEGDERGRVVGVAASADDRIIAIRARKGVVLATGAPIHLPCWRIFDARYAAKNKVAMWLGRRDPHWFRKAGSIARLARQIDLDPAVLAATVERFNGFARAGRDEDFRRGETQWEMFHTGDPTRPNRNGALATIEKPPFYAAPYHRAILTTKGGPRTNERGQVLRHDGSVIGGLYCACVAMANPIGTKAVGAGTTICPGPTWGYICGHSLLRAHACGGGEG